MDYRINNKTKYHNILIFHKYSAYKLLPNTRYNVNQYEKYYHIFIKLNQKNNIYILRY